jgi:hypothetical protein
VRASCARRQSCRWSRCDDPAGYRPALIPFISLLKANRPYVFCTIPHDSALNPGLPYEVLLA